MKPIDEILNLVKVARGNPATKDDLRKAGWSEATGLVMYDLQAPAIAIYPWMESLTPFRNELPRVPGHGGIATHWKAITAINTTNMQIGVAEGKRGGVVSTTVVDFNASYQGIGLEDSVTFEADYAAEFFDDAKARAVEGLMRALMLAEEVMIVGGNSSIALGTTPTPTAVGATTGGVLSDGGYYVGCVALTMDGLRRASVTLAGAVQTFTRQNADGSSNIINGGTAQPSAQSSVVTLAAGTAVQRVHASVTPVKGALGYAWYIGASAAHLYLQQITAINSVNFNTAIVTNTQDMVLMGATDNSRQNGFSFDGILYSTAFLNGSNSYYKALDTGTDGTGTQLTGDGAGGVNEVNDALKYFWDGPGTVAPFRLSPSTIWAAAQHVIDMTNLVIANKGAPLVRYNADAQGAANQVIGGNAILYAYLNKFTGQLVRIRIHPSLPNGIVLFTTERLPYQGSGVSTCHQIKYRRDYYQIEWPLQTRAYEYGIYADELYQNYAPFAFGAITNIANGVSLS